MDNKAAKNKSSKENCSGNKKRPKGEETFEGNISKSGFLGWCSSLYNFDFFTPPTRNVFVIAPATRFLPEMGRSQEDAFSYEGIRLASLCHLPSTCSVSRIRLAKAGFYFDASKTTRDARNLDEVVCYSCGVTYANWESGANPETIHRQLSPNCPHLKDQQEPVPERSHVKTRDTDGEINSGACSLGFGSATSTKTNILSSDPDGVHSYFVMPRTSTSSISEKNPPLGLRGGKLDSHTSPGIVNRTPKFDRTLETDCAASLPSDNTGYSPDFNDRPGMPLGSAVYPQFSSSQTRYTTFTAWTLSNISHFQPHLLVSLGFFYAGYADCIRCFHCGVGLKSWHPDDDPLIEHIRWRPHCGFLLATKGRRFVNNILASLQKNQQEPTIQSRTHGSSFTNGTSANIAPARERSSIAVLSPTNLGQLRDMGFKDEQISKAVQELGHSGSQITEVQALIDQLLELSLGIEEYENTPDVPRDSVPSRHDLSTDGCNSTSDSNVANRFRELSEENERLKERKLCKVCKSSTVGMIFLPCGHIVACTQCGAKIRHCTSCGEFVKATANIYLS